MKRFFLSLCFVAFLSASLVSCTDEAADITPQNEVSSPQFQVDLDSNKEEATRP